MVGMIGKCIFRCRWFLVLFLHCEFFVAETLLKASGQSLQWTSGLQLRLVGDAVVLSDMLLYRSSD